MFYALHFINAHDLGFLGAVFVGFALLIAEMAFARIKEQPLSVSDAPAPDPVVD